MAGEAQAAQSNGQAVIAFRSPSRRSGYAELPTVVILDEALSDAAVRLYALLVSYAMQSDGCIVTQKSIADDLKRSVRAVQRGLSELGSRRLVAVQRQGLTQPNIYWIENAYEAYDSKPPARKAGADAKKPAISEKNDRFVAPDATEMAYQETPKMAGQDATEMAGVLGKNPRKETKIEKTLNVGRADHFVTLKGNSGTDRSSQPASDGKSVSGPNTDTSDYLGCETAALVEELRDWGSERRHRQLLSICEQHNLMHLSRQALQATRDRLARTTKRGTLEKPGAYYQSVLISLLEGYQVFAPRADEEDAAEVRHLARMSLGLEEQQ